MTHRFSTTREDGSWKTNFLHAPAPFKMSIELHPDEPRVMLDPEPTTWEQKELALKFLQSVAANLQLANAQLGQQLVGAQSTITDERRLREEKLAEILLARERERSLLKLINDLESELTDVKLRVKKLDSHVEKLEFELSEIEVRVGRLLRKDATVTLREICRILERHLCLQVAGSKTKAKKYYFNFAKVKDDQTMFDSLQRELQKRGFTSSTSFIERLKDAGEFTVHQDRDSSTVDELRAQLFEQTEGDEEDRKESMAFLEALESFGMVSAEGRIEISRDPLM